MSNAYRVGRAGGRYLLGWGLPWGRGRRGGLERWGLRLERETAIIPLVDISFRTPVVAWCIGWATKRLKKIARYTGAEKPVSGFKN